MGYYVAPLKGPYDVRSLVEAYVYAQRTDFVHEDFSTYYRGLLSVLEVLFSVRLSPDAIPPERRALWHLFDSTVGSLLRVTSPWDGYLEAGLLMKKLEESGEPGIIVHRASKTIQETQQAGRRITRCCTPSSELSSERPTRSSPQRNSPRRVLTTPNSHRSPTTTTGSKVRREAPCT